MENHIYISRRITLRGQISNIEYKVYIEDLNAEEWCDIHKKYE